MKRTHQKTLEAVFAHPTSANIAWKDIEALLAGLGAEVSEREGSRVANFHDVGQRPGSWKTSTLTCCSMKCASSTGPTPRRRPTRAQSQRCESGLSNME